MSHNVPVAARAKLCHQVMHVRATISVMTCCLCLQEGILQTRSSQPGLPSAVCSLPMCAGGPYRKLSSFNQGKASSGQTTWLSTANACRKAILQAGMAQPDLIYAGLTSIKDTMSEQDKETFSSTLHERMSMLQQVDRFQVRLTAQKGMSGCTRWTA